MRSLIILSLSIVVLYGKPPAAAAQDVKIFKLDPPASGRIFLHLGTAKLSKPPNFYLFYNVGSIYNDASQIADNIHLIEKEILKSLDPNKSHIFDVWKNNSIIINKIILQLNDLLLNIHANFNIKDKNIDQFWSSSKFQPITNSNNEGFLNKKLTYWNKTKHISTLFSQLSNNSSISGNNFSTRLNWVNSTQEVFNNSIWNMEEIMAFNEDLQILQNNIFDLIEEITLIFSTAQYKVTTNIIIHTAYEYYLGKFPLSVSYENSNWNKFQKIDHYLRHGILIIKFNFPFKMSGKSSEIFYPISIPIHIAENTYFDIDQTTQQKFTNPLLLNYNDRNFTSINFTEIYETEQNRNNKYIMHPQEFNLKNESCNLNIFKEAIDSAEKTCKIKQLDKIQATKFISFGNSNMHFYFTPVQQSLKVKCNHVLKFKQISGCGFLKLNKNCTIVNFFNFKNKTIDIPFYKYESPQFKITYLKNFFTENYILKQLPKHLKDIYLRKRLHIEDLNLNIFYRIWNIIFKHHLVILKINTILLTLLIIIILLKIFNKSKREEDQVSNTYLRARPRSFLFRSQSLPTLEIENESHGFPKNCQNLSTNQHRRRPSIFSPHDVNIFLEATTLKANSIAAEPTQYTQNFPPPPLLTFLPTSTLFSISEEHENEDLHSEKEEADPPREVSG